MSKRLKFAPMILAMVFFSASFAPSTFGQSAQSLIQTGRDALKKQSNAGLQEAKTAFGRAVQAQPTNGEAIVLEVLTTIASEVLRPEFRQELSALGVQVTNDNLYLPSYQYPQDEEGNYIPPQSVRSDRGKDYANTRLSEVDRLLGLLQRITAQNFSTINLSAEETGLKAVRIDFMDVRMLRVIGHLFKASLAAANSYNTSLEYHLFYRAIAEDLTLQQLLAELPDFFKFATAAQRTEAREQLRLANVEFQAAVQLYFERPQGTSLTPYLFDFEDYQQAFDAAQVAQFLAAALYGPQTIPADVANPGSPFIGKTINFAPIFTSGTPLRSLLPTRYDRGRFRRDSWPSATFGGVLGLPDTDLLNEIGAGLGLVQGALYEPYDFSVLLGSDAPPPYSTWPNEQAYRPFTEISSIAADKLGNIFIADAGLNVIKRLSPDGKLTTVAGQEWTSWTQRDELLRKSSLQPNTGSNPNSNTAVLERPGALAIDPSNNLYFASRGRIFKLTIDGKLTALAGNDASPWNNQSADGLGGLARFSQITAMGADKDGNVYVVDGGTVLKKISPQGLVATLAGAFNQSGYADGPGAQARFGWIEGSIAVDSKGAVYLADASNGCVRKVEASGLVSTFVGNRGSQMHFDAALGKARVAWPCAVAIDSTGNLYFLDNTTVRKVSVDGKVVTLAGKPWSGNEEFEKMGVGENVRFGDWPYYPNSLSASADGKIYASNYRSIFVGKPLTLAPASSGGGGGGNSSVSSSTGPPWPDPPSATPRTGAGQLDSLSLSRTSVTIEGFPTRIEVTGSYRGNITWFTAEFRHQGSGRSLTTSDTDFNHPTAPSRSMTESRSLSAFVEIPANTRSGEWKLERVSYSDPNGGYVSLTGTDIPLGFRSLAFTVTNPDGGTIDETAPVPIAVQVTPSDINPSFYPHDAIVRPRVRLTVSDASHLSYANIQFFNPSDSNSWMSASFSGHQLVEINGAQKTYEADLYLPDNAVMGDWQIQSLSLSDEAGNGAYFYDSDYYYGTSLPNGFTGTIFRLGGSYPAYVPPTDTTAPFVSDLQISPATVDLSTGRKKVTMRLQVSDDVSGLRDISANLNSTAGSTTFFSQFKLVSGNHRNGVYEAQIIVPQTTPDGVHVANYLWLTDNAGNNIGYYEYAEAPWGRPLTPQLRKTLNVTGGNQPAPTGSVTSISASPTTLNTLSGNAELTFRFSVQGQSQPLNSWTPNGSIGVHSPSGTQYLWSEFTPAHLVSASGTTRTYEVVFRLPQYSEKGLWRLDYIQLSGPDYDTPSAYVMPANLSAAGLTPPTFTVQGVDRSWQQELVSLQPEKDTVQLSFGNLNFLFDGTEKRATATAPPVSLGTENIVFTYNGLTTAPIDVGIYNVVAYLDSPLYRGRAEAQLTITYDARVVARNLGGGVFSLITGDLFFSRLGENTGSLVSGTALRLRNSAGGSFQESLVDGWTGVAFRSVGSTHQIYWRNSSSKAVALWEVGSTGVVTSTRVLDVAGVLLAESNLNVDLDGDGQTGLQFGAIPPAQSARTIGNVSLGQTQLGYALRVGNGTPVQISNAGANASASTVPGWTPLGVVAGANSSYTLYWRNAASGQYAVWVLNAAGASTSGRLAGVGEILQVETNLNLDLDLDGQTGLQFGAIPPAQSARTIGNVSLGQTQLGYALRVNNGTPMQISNAGSNASASTVPGWTPVAAVAVGGDYELYWRNAAGQLALWQLGAQGASTGGRLLSLQDAQIAELRIQADIDGDGGIGPKFSGLVRKSQVGQPALPRWGHSQVWTGTRFIVWGGMASENNFAGTRTYHSDGGIYDPSSNTWEPIATAGAPVERGGHSTVWTGTDMIVWGGWGGPYGMLFADGFRYRPSENKWYPISSAGAPVVMDSGHSAVWTGTEMVVWGVSAISGQPVGGRYNPSTDTWRSMSTAGMPTARRGHAAVWNGSRMIVWGGKPENLMWNLPTLNGTGAMYDPVSDSWQPISSVGAPWGGETFSPSDGERSSELMWTGTRLVAIPINSLNYITGSFLQPGAQFDPNTGSWTSISTQGLPEGRPYLGTWTGSRIFMAGSSFDQFAGFVFDSAQNRWMQVVSGTTGSFEGRQGTWAPELKEMLVFGGKWLDGVSEFGGGADNRRGLRLQIESDIRFDASRQIGGVELGTTQLGYAIRLGSSIIQISNAGANASASTVPGWTPLGVVAGANSTYTLYWRNASSGQYAVWTLNAAGASTSGRLAGVGEILQVETNLNLDLDLDGQTGLQFGAIPPAQSVRTIGNVSLGQTQLGYALRVNNGTPIQISNAGANASASTVPGWTLLGVVAGANSSYTLYWRNAASGQYAVWVLNAAGASTSGRLAGVAEILQAETNLNVDLDGDGQTGLQFGAIPPAQGVRTIGNVSLGQTQLGYALRVNNGTPIQISNAGTNASASSVPGWTPLGVVAGANSTYTLYWRNASSGQYAVWTLNAAGASTSGRLAGVAEILQAETNLNVDLDGDGQTGLQFGAIPPAQGVRTIGNVSLGQTQLGYALRVNNGTPIQISNAGANASASTVLGWTPLGVVAGANSSYTLYWQNKGTGQYALWVLNATGASTLGRLAGVAEILQAETNLNVDLDGDGQTGLQFGAIPPAQGVRTIGNVSLGQTQLGYALRVNNGTPIQISNAGTNANASTLPGWTPLGVVAGANSTYTLYLRNASTGQYALWVLNAQGAVSSGRVASVGEILQVETNLNLDLDGDGQTGLQFGAIPPAQSVRTIGNVSLGQTQLGYALRVNNGTPIQISNAGANASATSVPGWTPLGVVAKFANNDYHSGVVAGYSLYWSNPNAGQFAVWDLNTQGATLSGRVLSLGELVAAETTHSADLNSDGEIGSVLPGIYVGQFSGNMDNGEIALLVLPDLRAVVLGYNSWQGTGVLVSSFSPNLDGTFSGSLYEGGVFSGAINKLSGSMTGNFSTNVGGFGSFSGSRVADHGRYSASVTGLYTGTFNSYHGTGTVYVILMADGRFFTYFIDPAYGLTSGGSASVGYGNSVDVSMVDGTTASGFFDEANKRITGSFWSPYTSGTFQVTRFNP